MPQQILRITGHTCSADGMWLERVEVYVPGSGTQARTTGTTVRTGVVDWRFVVETPFRVRVTVTRSATADGMPPTTRRQWLTSERWFAARPDANADFALDTLVGYAVALGTMAATVYPPMSTEFQEAAAALAREGAPPAVRLTTVWADPAAHWMFAPEIPMLERRDMAMDDDAPSKKSVAIGKFGESSKLNSLAPARRRYVCQPGDHSGDTWAIAAALLLAGDVDAVLTTKEGSTTEQQTPWVFFVDFESEFREFELVSIEVRHGGGTFPLGADRMDNGSMACPVEPTFRIRVVGFYTVREMGRDSLGLDALIHRFDVAGVAEVTWEEPGYGTAVLYVEHTGSQQKRFLDPAYVPSTTVAPVRRARVRIDYRIAMSAYALNDVDGKSKFTNKFNQAIEFYSRVGIERERIKIDRRLGMGRMWAESFNLGSRLLEEQRRGASPYGMTWSATSILMGAVEANGLPYVRGQLRDAFTRGMTRRDQDWQAGKLAFMSPREQYVFVNMRYATHNLEHNITERMYRQIVEAATQFGRTVVRIGVPDAGSQASGRDWMTALPEHAIDIYDVVTRPRGAPIEVDMRSTAHFWKCVADKGNVWVIGGRSGSFDVAAYMGVRSFTWDIIDRPEGVEQTEYARLWMSYPWMSIGSRSATAKGDTGLDAEMLLFWMAGFDVMPSADPPRAPFAPVGAATERTSLALLHEPLMYLTGVVAGSGSKKKGSSSGKSGGSGGGGGGDDVILIPADGDCLYRAVGDAENLRRGAAAFNVAGLRGTVADALHANHRAAIPAILDDILIDLHRHDDRLVNVDLILDAVGPLIGPTIRPFLRVALLEERDGDHAAWSAAAVTAYITDVRNSQMFGGELEANLLGTAVAREVVIYDIRSRTRRSVSPAVLGGRPIVLRYNGTDHYNLFREGRAPGD